MNLVIGATGHLGGEICRLLAAAGKPVRALVRHTSDPAKVEALRALGADVAVGDLKDASSLARACDGAAAVLTTATSISSPSSANTFEDTDLGGHLTLVDVARRSGVGHFVFTSFSKGLDVDCPLGHAKRTVERAIRESGMTYTILRPTAFMESWLGAGLGFDLAGGRVQLFGDGDAPVSYISFRDVARFAVAALDNPAARNAELELGGPEAVRARDVIALAEQVGGRKIEATSIPAEALEAQYAAAQDPMQKTFAALALSVARGNAIPMDETLRRFPVRMTTVKEYVERQVGRE